jgi:hypothetical protein
MRHNIFISGLLVILAISVSVSSSHAIHWCKSFYQEELDTYGMDIEATSDGGFIIAGNADSKPPPASPIFIPPSQLFLITKLSDDGSREWQRTYSFTFTEPKEQKATGVVEVLSEDQFHEERRGFLVTGYARIGQSKAAVVMKLNVYGDVEWHQIYFNEDYNVIPGAITYNDNGTVAIAGAIEPLGVVPQDIADLGAPVDRDVWVIELDLADPLNEGQLLWQKAFDFENREMEAAVAVIFDGNDVVVGSNMLDTQGQYDISILKLDAAGNVVKTAMLGAPANAVHDQITSIAISANGNYVLTGLTQDPTVGGWWKVFALELHMPLAGTNSCLWMNSYQLSEKSSLSYAIEATPLNQYAISGSVYSSSDSVRNGLLLVLDSAGNMSQALQYGGKLDDGFYDLDVFEVEGDVEERPEYAIATTGFTRSFPDNGTQNLWAMSLNRFGRPDHADSCLISLPSVMIQKALSWDCACGHPDLVTTTPMLEQIQVDIQLDDFESHPGIICVDLF